MITDRERKIAKANIKSRVKAIDLMCKDCIYDDHEKGTWRQQTENCPSERTCPLWNFRPMSRTAGLSPETEPTTDERSPGRGVEVYRKPKASKGQE